MVGRGMFRPLPRHSMGSPLVAQWKSWSVLISESLVRSQSRGLTEFRSRAGSKTTAEPRITAPVEGKVPSVTVPGASPGCKGR